MNYKKFVTLSLALIFSIVFLGLSITTYAQSTGESININNTTLTFNKIYYVDGDIGNDTTGDGSSGKPLKTVIKAVARCASGDAVFVKGNIPNQLVTIGTKTLTVIGDYLKYGSTLDGFRFKTSASNNRPYGKLTLYNLKLKGKDTYTWGESLCMLDAVLYNCIFEDAASSYSNVNGTFKFYNCFINRVANLSHGNTSFVNCAFKQKNKTSSCLGGVTVDPQYNITSAGWQNTGNGTNPDGSIANIGVYGGNFAWGYVSKPTAPNLTAQAEDSKVELSWNNVDGALAYNVKRTTTVGGPYTTIATTSAAIYTDTNVSNGATYYYVVSTVNAGGEGANSNEVSATPKNPAVTLEVTSVDKAKTGDEITADVVIHNAEKICAEDIKIAFDTSKLEFVSAEGSAGIKIYKEAEIATGIKRYITASLGKTNAANGDKILLKLKFKAIAKGEAKIDITKGRIADNATLETDVEEKNCGEKTILIEGTKDVNRSGEYTLLDLGIDAWYYGDAASDTDTSKYDADQDGNNQIDDSDLSKVVEEILLNSNYRENH